TMSPVVLWGLLVLLVQQSLVCSHVLGRPSSSSDLSQLKSLLERFEETLAEAAEAEDQESDYEGTDQQPENSQSSQQWSPDRTGNEERLAPGRALNQKSLLQDLLLTARKRSSGCFGARMDRIGNASGLGCNSGRGKTAIRKIRKCCELLKTLLENI
uniref:Natriuretic peptides A-like n=1 Tax=Gouania willdenowi TaxID=441366 RepID=A0A8C5E210_GOUWI